MYNYEPLDLSKHEDYYSLTMVSNYNKKFFKKYKCKCTGDLLEAIARYLIRINELDANELEFDSEKGMFCCVYCNDKTQIENFAIKFQKALNDETFLEEAMQSDEVKDELDQENDLKTSVLSTLLGKNNLSNSLIFNKYFNENNSSNED